MLVNVTVARINPLATRLTPDVDIAVDRSHVGAIRAAFEPDGYTFQQAAGFDGFVDANEPKARSPVHLVFVNEKVRPEYLEPVPASEPVTMKDGILIAPVADLVRMKLTSFRLKDKVHIQDLDSVGLITAEIESGLSDALRQRLAEVRVTG